MRKKLTIMVDKHVYKWLHEVVGRRRISTFIEKLVRPYVEKESLDESYKNMAADEEREREAVEWSEVTIRDVGNESR